MKIWCQILYTELYNAKTNDLFDLFSLSCVELLLEHGADPNHKLKDSSTMLIEAAKGGHTAVVQLLLDWPGTQLASQFPPDFVLPEGLTIEQLRAAAVQLPVLQSIGGELSASAENIAFAHALLPTFPNPIPHVPSAVDAVTPPAAVISGPGAMPPPAIGSNPDSAFTATAAVPSAMGSTAIPKPTTTVNSAVTASTAHGQTTLSDDIVDEIQKTIAKKAGEKLSPVELQKLQVG